MSTKNNVRQFTLSPRFCTYNSIAIVKQDGNEITFIMEHFEDEALKDTMRKSFKNYLRNFAGFITFNEKDECNMRVSFVKGNYNEVRSYISKLYGASNVVTADVSSSDTSTARNMAIAQETSNQTNDSAAEILLDSIISEARKKFATDIHIEQNAVRFRVYGRLVHIMDLQEERARELIQRIKLLSRMNVLEKRKSQDGQFMYGLKDNIFVRVSCMGVVGNGDDGRGESVVLRLLDPKRVPLSVDTLGLSEMQCEDLQKLYTQRSGLVLICGATGSGKSTTAAAMLLEIQKQFEGARKIISIEDPPEYVLPGVTQIRVEQNGAGDFVDALVSIFRQDPDVIFIGEIRDENSAQTAVQAALTGHLVFATLHTSDAAGAVFRMLNFGVNRNIFISVLRGVISQQLLYDEDKPKLVADVATVLSELQTIATVDATAEEIDKGFVHRSNAMSFIAEAIRRLPEPSWKKSLKVPHVHSERKDDVQKLA